MARNKDNSKYLALELSGIMLYCVVWVILFNLCKFGETRLGNLSLNFRRNTVFDNQYKHPHKPRPVPHPLTMAEILHIPSLDHLDSTLTYTSLPHPHQLTPPLSHTLTLTGLILFEHANVLTYGFSGSLVVSGDDDDTDAGLGMLGTLLNSSSRRGSSIPTTPMSL